MLTPEKKAIELFQLFYDLVPTRVMHYKLHCILAHDCAIAHANEILKLRMIDYMGRGDGSSHSEAVFYKEVRDILIKQKEKINEE